MNGICRRSIAVAVLAIGLFVALAPSVQAATTIGQTFTPTTICGMGSLSFAQESVSSGNSYVIPAGGGVLTSWSFQAAPEPQGKQLALRIFTKQASPNYTAVAESTLQTLTPAQLNTFPTRIPVSGGELIGFLSPGGSFPCAVNTGNIADKFVATVPASPLGSSVPHDQSNARLDIAASLEPDADKDGFGDETQDLCPTQAGTQGPCVQCKGEVATIVGSDLPDAITGTAGRDVIALLAGADTAKGKGGNDLICGGNGNDDLKGQQGKDQLFGDRGKDELNGGGGKGDLCNGGKGSDDAKGSCEKERSI
jgi:hemolysin type calcium-binding protein